MGCTLLYLVMYECSAESDAPHMAVDALSVFGSVSVIYMVSAYSLLLVMVADGGEQTAGVLHGLFLQENILVNSVPKHHC